MPTAETGTYDDRQSLLLTDQAPGIWFFHIVNIDRFGRTSPLAGHYQVRIGPDPGTGNVAGTITDATTGSPVAGALVELNGGLIRTVSGETGDYTFRGEVPAVTEPYRVTVTARGYLPAEGTVTVGAGAAEVLHFALDPDPTGPTSDLRLGWEFRLSDAVAHNPSLALGPPGLAIWAREGNTRDDEEVAIVRQTGETIMSETTWEEYSMWGARTEVGWNGEQFHALEYYKCDDDGSLRFGHGWSCLRMRTWSPTGEVLGGWLAYRNSGQTGSPSVAWNGTSYGTFFISYSALYYQEITADLDFAGGGTATSHVLLAGGYGDTRQSARTRAIWDGDAYAVAWSLEAPGEGPLTLYFGRWSRDLAPLLDPTTIDLTASRLIGLVFDGERYHLAYVRVDGARRDLVLRAIEPDGTLGERTVLAADTPSTWTEPSLAFDGRELLVTWAGGAGADEGVLEARATLDHSLVERVELGRVMSPRVAADAGRGDALLIYTRDDAPGTYLRQLHLD